MTPRLFMAAFAGLLLATPVTGAETSTVTAIDGSALVRHLPRAELTPEPRLAATGGTTTADPTDPAGFTLPSDRPIVLAEGGPDDMPGQPVEATFRADTGTMEIAITWSAVPAPGQNLPPEAWAMQEGAYGPVTELFLPGAYDVTGDAGDNVFFGRVQITPAGPNDFVIPRSDALSPAGEDSTEGYLCPGPDPCSIEDATGLVFVLPGGWRSDMPFLAETAGGVTAAAPTATFLGPDGSPMLLLNPLRWIESNGPCTDSPAGALCIFGTPDGAALAALAVILPSLGYQARSE